MELTDAPVGGELPTAVHRVVSSLREPEDPVAMLRCFQAETARARGNACFGEGDAAGAVAEWSRAIEIAGDLDIARESTARALANRSHAKLSFFGDCVGAVADAAAAVAADPTYARAYARHALALRCALGDGAPEVGVALAAAAGVGLGERDRAQMKRERTLAAKRRSAYEADVARLSTTRFTYAGESRTFDAHAAARLASCAPARRGIGAPAAARGLAVLPRVALARVVAFTCVTARDSTTNALTAARLRVSCRALLRAVPPALLASAAPLTWERLAGLPPAAAAALTALAFSGEDAADGILASYCLTRCAGASRLRLTGGLAFPLDAALSLCGSRLVRLTLDATTCSPEFWDAALRGCPMLAEVRAAPRNGANALAAALGSRCGLLKEVVIDPAYDLARGAAKLARCAELRRLEARGAAALDADDLAPLLERCGRLTVLALDGCAAIDDEFLLDVAEAYEGDGLSLRELSVAGTAVTAAGVANLEPRVPRIRVAPSSTAPPADLLTGL